MQVQRLQNNNYIPQFNGTLTIKNIHPHSDKQPVTIHKQADVDLYNMFVRILGEEPEAWGSTSGNTWFKADIVNYIAYVNKLLGTNILIKPKNPSENIFYFYSTDGKGKILYQIGYLSDPNTIEHSLNIPCDKK